MLKTQRCRRSGLRGVGPTRSSVTPWRDCSRRWRSRSASGVARTAKSPPASRGPPSARPRNTSSRMRRQHRRPAPRRSAKRGGDPRSSPRRSHSRTRRSRHWPSWKNTSTPRSRPFRRRRQYRGALRRRRPCSAPRGKSRANMRFTMPIRNFNHGQKFLGQPIIRIEPRDLPQVRPCTTRRRENGGEERISRMRWQTRHLGPCRCATKPPKPAGRRNAVRQNDIFSSAMQIL
mmetsp:Transcript_18949/g.71718  ORF Transcript_18949/g.71718 Transcript_18949/m.71718 type:complete len:232 (-) Transcript_18949:1405-2100(-)